MKSAISIVCMFVLMALYSSVLASDSLSIHDAWIRSAPPNAKVMAAYMTITNVSAETRTLTQISSSLFKKIEIHRTEIHEGLARMIPQKGLMVPASESVVLEPGGYHLMLIEPIAVPREGDEVDLELYFDNGRSIHIKVQVHGGVSEGNIMDKHHH